MLQLLYDCTALSKLAQVERFKLKTIHQCLLKGRANCIQIFTNTCDTGKACHREDMFHKLPLSYKYICLC